MQQQRLFEIAVLPNPEAIRCQACGAALCDLKDLRERCEVTGVIHKVSTVDHNALYRNTYEILLD
ncbi:MAG: hypothetical protein WBV94_24825 [Blastocatellia bacterium]